MSEEIKNKILDGAEAMFLRFGFKSITMDDIARELGISKKTLYQFFEDKNALVDQTVERYLTNEMAWCNKEIDNLANPIEFMLRISDSYGDLKRQISPSILFDLKKYFKVAWDKLNNFRVDFIFNEVLRNLKKGKELGYYHADMDENLTARFYIHLIDMLINPEDFKDEPFNLKAIQSELLRYHLRAICTAAGMKYLDSSELFKKIK